MEIREPIDKVASNLGLVVTGSSYEDALQKLAARINTLIEKDLHQLISILYRMDISEPRLRTLLRDNEGKDAGLLIAAMMVEREAQKIRSRREHQRDNDISEEEKW
jgi:hypothetical protein